MSLKHRLLCLLKTSKENDSCQYEKVLQDQGFSVISLPILRFSFIETPGIFTCLQDPVNFSGLILTSQRAVESLSYILNKNKAEWEEKLRDQWNKLPIFAVGKSTSTLASTLLGLQATGDDAGNAEILLATIKQVISPNGKPLLFPCGNLKKETIPIGLAAVEIACKAITVYYTCVDLDFSQALKHLIDLKGVPEFFVFFSPSGVNFFHQVFYSLSLSSESIKFIAIGPSTQEALEKHGYSVAATASHPTPEALSEAVSLKCHF